MTVLHGISSRHAAQLSEVFEAHTIFRRATGTDLKDLHFAGQTSKGDRRSPWILID